MGKIDLIMPKMGESIIEATILKWTKNVGDKVELDETILEIATDKVDSEIPSPVDGVLSEILYKEDDVVAVGEVIARLSTEGGNDDNTVEPKAAAPAKESKPAATPVAIKPTKKVEVASTSSMANQTSDRFYSPLVKTIAKQEGISYAELDTISGSGSNGRVNKADILAYVDARSSGGQQNTIAAPIKTSITSNNNAISQNHNGNTEIIEMDRMRKMIADHMVRSKHTSPHVTSFVEVDVTNMVNWRNKVKHQFVKKHGQKITYTPLIMDAVIKALRDFPMVNVSVDGTKIIKKNYINLGMAAALPSGNLIVPVIKDADKLNLLGLTEKVNDLASRARANKLKPEEIQDGTFTLTNVGTFGNVMGTPIINQPQAAIMAAGAIRKKPAVLETEHGDVIAIRHMMFLSLSYDHRVVDGFLGGSFLKRTGDYLEAFDTSTSI